MKRSFILSGCVALLTTLACSSCYYGIPTVVEVANQDRIQKEEQGRRPESKTGAIRLLTSNKIDQQDRINHIIRGYNAIMTGSFNVIASQHLLKKDTIPALQMSSHMAFPITAHLEQAIEYFKKSQKTTHFTKNEFNILIPQAIKLSQKLLSDETSTAPYFRQGVYRRDNYAGAKKMLPILEQDYAKLIYVMNQIGQILFQLQQTDIQHQINYDDTKLGFYSEKSLLLSMQLIKGFQKNVKLVKQDATYIQANHTIGQLKETLVHYQERLSQAKQINSPHVDTQDVIDSLNQMILHYTELQKNKSYITYNLMMKRYSEAILSYNQKIGHSL